MGSWSRIRNTFGLLAVGASIALASPGVNVVRAETDGSVAQVAPGSQCSASRPADSLALELNAMIEQLQLQEADQNASDGDFVVLNNHGYNYRPTRAIKLDPTQAAPPQR